LVFDTTAAACSIALVSDGKIIASYSRQFDFGQAEVLLPEIKNMLNQNQISFNQISGIFVCVGPGSFTGVRASISAAKVFALANPQMVISGFSAFDAYITELSDVDISDCNAVIIETRRDDFYVRFYDCTLSPLSEPQALNRDDIIAFLKKNGAPVTLLGDGVERFLNSPSGLVLHSIKMPDHISVSALANVATAQLKNHKINFPKPLYIRAADVTVNTK